MTTTAARAAQDTANIRKAIGLIMNTDVYRQNDGDPDLNIVRAVMCLESHLQGERWVS